MRARPDFRTSRIWWEKKGSPATSTRSLGTFSVHGDADREGQAQGQEDARKELLVGRRGHVEDHVVDVQVVVPNEGLVEEIDLVGDEAEQRKGGEEGAAQGDLQDQPAKPDPCQDE